MNVTYHQIQGPRQYQEDRILVQYGHHATIVAVFDGHGGSEAADIARNTHFSVDDNLAFIFHQLNMATQHLISGTTASIVKIQNNKAEVGILGDSPVVIKDVNGKIITSPQHNVRINQQEADSVIAKGGIIYDGYAYSQSTGSGLQMSRTLGDVYLNAILSRQPEIYDVELGPESYILVASDGLFDPSHGNSGIPVNVFNLLNDKNITAKSLVDSVIPQDNVSAILVKM
jgi:serine/threonine protein phosphatase PrpC